MGKGDKLKFPHMEFIQSVCNSKLIKMCCVSNFFGTLLLHCQYVYFSQSWLVCYDVKRMESPYPLQGDLFCIYIFKHNCTVIMKNVALYLVKSSLFKLFCVQNSCVQNNENNGGPKLIQSFSKHTIEWIAIF